MRGLAFVLLLSLSILAVPAAAGAHGGDPNVVHACVHKDPRDGEVHGHVRIVLPNQECRKNEAPLHLGLPGSQAEPPGPPGPQGPAGPTGPAGPPGSAGGGLLVVDSVGNGVGHVVGLMFDGSQRVLPNVILQQQGLMVGLMVTPNGFEGSGGSLAFSLAGYKGQAFLSSDFTTLILPGTIEGPGNTVYVPDPSATPGPVTAQSLLQLGTCFSFQFDLPSAVPALPLVNLDTLYTPPFSLK